MGRESGCSRLSRLPATARCATSCVPLDSAQPRDRPERQRQVEPLSRAAPARRDRAGARHPVAGARRRAAVDAVGGAGGVLARGAARRAAGAGDARRKGRSACGSDSPATTSATRSISACRRRQRRVSAAIRRSSASASGTASTLRPSALLVDRRGPLVQGARGAGRLDDPHARSCATFDSMMTHCADPRHTPEMLMLREEMRAWRFYDHFRTDALAPARLPQIGTHTPVLSHDGADLAAALQTIREIGDGEALERGGRRRVSRIAACRCRMATAGSRWRCSSTACCGR